MTETILCPQCGSAIPAGSPAALCPKCLVLAGLESQPLAAEPQPTQSSPPPGSSGFVPPAIAELAALFPQLEILELLGRGGIGAVYKARQPGLERLVALKILPKEIGGDPAFAERFTREARALARLNHPNIVAVYDFGQTPSLPSPAGRGAGGGLLKSQIAVSWFCIPFSFGRDVTDGRLRPFPALAANRPGIHAG